MDSTRIFIWTIFYSKLFIAVVALVALAVVKYPYEVTRHAWELVVALVDALFVALWAFLVLRR